ncbi:MAG: hypothetical protein J7K64_00735 [Bacteroidales bacterium]|nr:hypothetical protein [Bacteroidales bacterium]
MHKINLILTGLILLFSVAVKSQDFEVAPVKMNFKVDPEESQTKILSIKNHSNFRTSFTISFADFVIDKEGNKQAIERNSSKTSCTEWITPEQTFFDINPNEQVQVKITMLPPVDDYTTRWALMYIQTVTEKTSFDVDEGMGAGVRLSGRIAVEIYRDPVLQLKSKLKIKDLREINNIDSTNRYFTADVLNTGKNIAKCKVNFIASDLNTAEEIEFDPIYFNSYPGFLREIKFKLPAALPPGKYSLVALLDYGKNVTIEGIRLNKPLIILPSEDSDNNQNDKK